MKQILIIAIAMCLQQGLFAQQAVQDTTNIKILKEVTIKAWQRKDISQLPDEQNGYLFANKKSEVINLAGINANIAIKTGRQIFAKVPGIFVYDMDGSGNQLNISSRGLDPHRSWEFNNRQNGVIINSDMYGYPASHYSAPLESFEKIELVRGTASLQYGAQFGGLINYVTKKADTSKAFTFESINTAGSFNLSSTYNAISGTYKKLSYYAYYYERHSDGYRTNSQSDANAQFIQLNYQFSPKFVLKAEFGRSKYLYHLSGPLTDSMFNANPRMSTRSRNYFSPDIYVPSITLQWQLAKLTKISAVASSLFGNRSSVQLDAFANIPDSINKQTNAYKNRQVDIDQFNSRTIETRLLHQYTKGKIVNNLSAGIVYMNNDLNRKQLAKGTTGSDYDLSLVEPGFVRDIHFKSQNIAFFAENNSQLTNRLSVSVGARYETGKSQMVGDIKYYTANDLTTTINHQFTQLGISSQYVFNKNTTLFGGFSQAYRPVILKDIVPASTYEQIDKNLKDAYGYNFEIGVKGKLFNHIQYNINYFRLLYNNRLGTLVMQDNAGQAYTYKTNIGNSLTNGFEAFVQYKFAVSKQLYLGIFSSTAFTDAKYISGSIASAGVNKTIEGNKVEATPEWISRNGLEILYKRFTCTLLYNYTAASYSDALNTVTPSANGAVGFTPSYGIWDFNANLQVTNSLNIKAGISNLFYKQYFTKRPTFYPGPGIWSSDGRNLNITLGIKI